MERACRPDSVRRRTGVTIIRLGGRLPGRSSHLPARSGGPPCAVRRPRACLLDVAPDGVWRAGRVATSAVSSYLTISPLPSAPANRRRLGGVLSVPLSVALGLAACCAWPLASILPCGVRTFLRRRRLRAAASDRPTRSIVDFTTASHRRAGADRRAPCDILRREAEPVMIESDPGRCAHRVATRLPPPPTGLDHST